MMSITSEIIRGLHDIRKTSALRLPRVSMLSKTIKMSDRMIKPATAAFNTLPPRIRLILVFIFINLCRVVFLLNI